MIVKILEFYAGLALAVQLVSIALLLWRFRVGLHRKSILPAQPITIIRPLCGIDYRLEDCLRSGISDFHDDIDYIYVVADADDPAIEVARAIMESYPNKSIRLFIGDVKVSDNPKLNNMARGWPEAKYPYVAVIDSNVLLPKDFVEQLFANWDKSAGMVSSPPIGGDAKNRDASLEMAWLNTYQARWQLDGDQLGNGFAQGKLLFYQKSIIEDAGGIAVLGKEVAEDLASTIVVRKAGKKVRLLQFPPMQPLGERQFRTVINRQIRWARIRHDGFPLIYLGELFSFAIVPLVLVALMVAFATPTIWFGLGYWVIWYGAEWLLQKAAHWPGSWRSVPLYFWRDLLVPYVWFKGFGKEGFEWRGNAMSATQNKS